MLTKRDVERLIFLSDLIDDIIAREDVKDADLDPPDSDRKVFVISPLTDYDRLLVCGYGCYIDGQWYEESREFEINALFWSDVK